MASHPFIERIRQGDLIGRVGRVQRVLPTFIEADGPALPVGAICRVETSRVGGGSGKPGLAEIVGIHPDRVVLAPLSPDLQTYFGAEVRALDEALAVPVGTALLGRAVDAMGAPLDGLEPPARAEYVALSASVRAPMSRLDPTTALDTGIRAIDGLFRLAVGQRVGVFAAAGAGKTSLVTQLARQVEADACVICLVGERGREVEALWSESLTDEVRRRTTLVAATSDQAAALRVRACRYGFRLAEHLAEDGRHVLLVLDSATRLAMALREVGLAAGEPPTIRAYPPSVFSAIPSLIERCGVWRSGGAITAIVTVLSESDDVDDPICEMMKSLLDGHIILSRELAEQGRFPAIDPTASLSRLARKVTEPSLRAAADQVLQWLSAYAGAQALIEGGLYVEGADPQIDAAIRRKSEIEAFLRQSGDAPAPWSQTRAWLARLAEASL